MLNFGMLRSGIGQSARLCIKKPEPSGSLVPASILGGSNEPPQTGQERRIRFRVYTLFRITQISGSPLMAVSDVAACFSALSVPSSLTHLAGATPLLTFGRRFRLTIFPFGKRARHFIALAAFTVMYLLGFS